MHPLLRDKELLDPNAWDMTTIRKNIFENKDLPQVVAQLIKPVAFNKFWQACISLGHMEGIKMLMDCYHKNPNHSLTASQVSQAVTEGEYAILDYVLKTFDVNASDGYLLYCAFFHEDTAMQTYLIDKGASVSLLSHRISDILPQQEKNLEYLKEYEEKHLYQQHLQSLLSKSDDAKDAIGRKIKI